MGAPPGVDSGGVRVRLQKGGLAAPVLPDLVRHREAEIETIGPGPNRRQIPRMPGALLARVGHHQLDGPDQDVVHPGETTAVPAAGRHLLG